MTSAIPLAGRRRRVLGWIALVVTAVVLGGVLVLTASREWAPRDPFDPEGPGPDGARAVVRLLDERLGGEVVPVADRASALEAVGDDGLLVVGDTFPLDDEQVEELASAPGDLLLLSPSERDLRVLFRSGFAEYGDGEAVTADCGLPAARTAERIAPGEAYLRGDADTACFPVGEGFALLRDEGATGAVTAFDAAAVLSNAHLAEHGHAAFALGLLSSAEPVVWYVPSLGEAAGGVPATLGDLTPGWVTPAIVVLAAAAIAAGVWRGRRFGPLVAETLPVTVRASETTEGRARLYARAADPAHAAGLLRAGATRRLSALLSLPAAATTDEVADAAAQRLGADDRTVRDILSPLPANDAELAACGERLRDLEAAVAAAVHSERTTT